MSKASWATDSESFRAGGIIVNILKLCISKTSEGGS